MGKLLNIIMRGKNPTPEILASGKYESTEYLLSSTSAGAFFEGIRTTVTRVTVIRFADGSTRVLPGHFSVPFAKDTEIQILKFKDGYEEYHYEIRDVNNSELARFSS